jgi:hypothetical protein
MSSTWISPPSPDPVPMKNVILTLLLLLAPLARAQTTQPTTRPAGGYIISCYQQPLENLAVWKARGCNAAIGPELGNPPRTTGAKWCAEAARLGMGVIGNSTLLKDKFVPPNLIAWYVDDEPNEDNHITTTGMPMLVAAQAQAMRALKNVPVICNFGGDKLTSAGPRDNALYEAYIRIPGAPDVFGNDWHVINRQAERYPISFQAKANDYLKERGAKVLLQHVETTWQWLNNGDPKGRQPTADEVEQEVRQAVEHGASYIVYFSTTQSGHWGWPQSYDTTPPDVSTRISALSAWLNPSAPPPPPPPPVVTLPFPRVLNATVTEIPGLDRIYMPKGQIFTPSHLLQKRGINDEVRGLLTGYAREAAAAKRWFVLEHPEWSTIDGDRILAWATSDTPADRQAASKLVADAMSLLQRESGGRCLGVYGYNFAGGWWNDTLEQIAAADKDLKDGLDASPVKIVDGYAYYHRTTFPLEWWEQTSENVRMAKRVDPKKWVYVCLSPVWQFGAPEELQGKPIPSWMLREQLRMCLRPQNAGRLGADGVILWSANPVPDELIKVIQEETAAAK